ncbi:hypothetical protein GIB67_024145 [Kingdonia uniflora]|uniref:SWIM-type domain-containing protein n=1 Tax=Kingdonia uniflora TaxID=39325 RepID=A0A7J7LZK5_9MAGN|nr:hypothetical protein GIB67_024145 [Kingdonia uniflora]
MTMEDSVDKNWSKVIGEESPERCENERIVDPFSAEAPYEDQFGQVVRLVAIERHVGGNVRQLTVKSHSGRAESFELQIDLEKLTGNCGCKLFEYVGFPCCHLLKVFSKYDILKIPKAFIKTRWTIGANKFSGSYDESQLEGDNLRHALCHSPISLRASNLFERASKMKENSLVSGTMISNPLVVQTKGRAKIDHKKGARWKGGMEEAIMKKKRTCKSCGVLGNHDKRACPLLKMMITESRDNNNGESIQPLHSNSDKHNI